MCSPLSLSRETGFPLVQHAVMRLACARDASPLIIAQSAAAIVFLRAHAHQPVLITSACRVYISVYISKKSI